MREGLDTEGALIPALRAENERLREQVEELSAQVAALERMHQDLVSSLSFRVTAPARRVQEQLRRRKQRRRVAAERDRAVLRARGSAQPKRRSPWARVRDRRAGSRAANQAVTATVVEASGVLVGLVPPPIPAEQAARHPLLARTANWAAGGRLVEPYRLPQRRLPPEGPRVLVIAHVFYPELWAELAERVARIPEPCDLVVTLVAGHSDGLVHDILAQFPSAIIETVANRGRDMLPLLRVLDLGLVGPYDAVLKVHTKKAAHRWDGARWRTSLLDSLCPSPDGIALILDLMRRDPTVGMVAPDGYIVGAEFWGSNGPLIEAMACRVPLGFDPEQVWFAAGSMFWTRPRVLNRLLEPNLTAEDFEYEAAALDGTTAHALERYIGVVVADEQLSVLSSADVAGRLAAALGAR